MWEITNEWAACRFRLNVQAKLRKTTSSRLDLVDAIHVHLELDIRSVIVWPAVIGPRSSNEPRGDWYRKLTRGLQEISIT